MLPHTSCRLELKTIICCMIAFVTCVVSTTCITTTMLVATDSLRNLGESWASSIGSSVAARIDDAYKQYEAMLLTPSSFAKVFSPMLPYDLLNRQAISRNWTDDWIPYILHETSMSLKNQNAFASLNLIFEDNFWMYTARSRADNKTQLVEWHELLDPVSQPTTVSSGAFRYYISNLTRQEPQYDARTNFSTEGVFFNIDLLPATRASFAQSTQVLANLHSSRGLSVGEPACIWLPRFFRYSPERKVFWISFLACRVKNASGFTLGHAFAEIEQELQIQEILLSTSRSPNSQVFVVDSNGYLVTTTVTSEPFWESRILQQKYDPTKLPSQNTPPPPSGPGCTVSNPADHSIHGYNYREGCRARWDNFSAFHARPLKLLSKEFVTSPADTAFAFVKDSDTGNLFAASSVRISSQFGLVHNIIVIVPGDDVRLNFLDKKLGLAIGLVVVVLLVAISVTTFLITSILKRLEDIHTKMIMMAELRNLDVEDFRDGNLEKSEQQEMIDMMTKIVELKRLELAQMQFEQEEMEMKNHRNNNNNNINNNKSAIRQRQKQLNTAQTLLLKKKALRKYTNNNDDDEDIDDDDNEAPDDHYSFYNYRDYESNSTNDKDNKTVTENEHNTNNNNNVNNSNVDDDRQLQEEIEFTAKFSSIASPGNNNNSNFTADADERQHGMAMMNDFLSKQLKKQKGILTSLSRKSIKKHFGHQKEDGADDDDTNDDDSDDSSSSNSSSGSTTNSSSSTWSTNSSSSGSSSEMYNSSDEEEPDDYDDLLNNNHDPTTTGTTKIVKKGGFYENAFLRLKKQERKVMLDHQYRRRQQRSGGLDLYNDDSSVNNDEYDDFGRKQILMENTHQNGIPQRGVSTFVVDTDDSNGPSSLSSSKQKSNNKLGGSANKTLSSISLLGNKTNSNSSNDNLIIPKKASQTSLGMINNESSSSASSSRKRANGFTMINPKNTASHQQHMISSISNNDTTNSGSAACYYTNNNNRSDNNTSSNRTFTNNSVQASNNLLTTATAAAAAVGCRILPYNTTSVAAMMFGEGTTGASSNTNIHSKITVGQLLNGSSATGPLTSDVCTTASSSAPLFLLQKQIQDERKKSSSGDSEVAILEDYNNNSSNSMQRIINSGEAAVVPPHQIVDDLLLVKQRETTRTALLSSSAPPAASSSSAPRKQQDGDNHQEEQNYIISAEQELANIQQSVNHIVPIDKYQNLYPEEIRELERRRNENRRDESTREFGFLASSSATSERKDNDATGSASLGHHQHHQEQKQKLVLRRGENGELVMGPPDITVTRHLFEMKQRQERQLRKKERKRLMIKPQQPSSQHQQQQKQQYYHYQQPMQLFEKNNNNNNIDSSDDKKNQSAEKENRSWISEIAAVEDAYEETKRNLQNFTRYVSKAVVAELIAHKRLVGVDDRTRGLPTMKVIDEATICFIEIDNFSKLWFHKVPTPSDNNNNKSNHHRHHHTSFINTSALQQSRQTICQRVLKLYFQRVCRLILGHHGVVDKLLADKVIAYWGAPQSNKYHALLASLCALAVQREANRDPLKKIFSETFDKKLNVRIGISSGTCSVGSIETGSGPDIMKNNNSNNHRTSSSASCDPASSYVTYTILGQPLFIARNLLNFGRKWQISTLVDAGCARRCFDTLHLRLLGNVKLMRQSRATLVYELCGLDLDSEMLREFALVKTEFKKVPKKKGAAPATAVGTTGGAHQLLNEESVKNNNINMTLRSNSIPSIHIQLPSPTVTTTTEQSVVGASLPILNETRVFQHSNITDDDNNNTSRDRDNTSNSNNSSTFSLQKITTVVIHDDKTIALSDALSAASLNSSRFANNNHHHAKNNNNSSTTITASRKGEEKQATKVTSGDQQGCSILISDTNNDDDQQQPKQQLMNPPNYKCNNNRLHPNSNIVTLQQQKQQRQDTIILAEQTSQAVSLLRWHITRTSLNSPPIVRFIEKFTEAARECIDCRFVECTAVLESIENDEEIPKELKREFSLFHLYKVAQLYSRQTQEHLDDIEEVLASSSDDNHDGDDDHRVVVSRNHNNSKSNKTSKAVFKPPPRMLEDGCFVIKAFTD